MKEPLYIVTLLDGEATILQEIADPKISSKSIALTYGLIMKGTEKVNWGKINAAIMERFGEKGLIRIKEQALAK